MAKKKEIQHFALNKRGGIVDVQNIEDGDQETYFCPHCKEEVITKRGKRRQWHFAHKKKTCDYDKYLHSIAEILIKQWFDKQEVIILDMAATEKCSDYNRCVFRHECNCMRECRVSYNLKQFYSSCTPERKYKGFVADLLCERHKDDDTPSL